MTLGMNWPRSGAQVKLEVYAEVDGEVDSYAIRYHLQAEPTKEGFRVWGSDFHTQEVQLQSSRKLTIAPPRGAVGELYTTPEGSFLEAGDPAAFGEMVRASIASRVDAGGILSEPSERLLDGMLQPDSMAVANRNAWTELTRGLGGTTIAVNEVLESETQAPVPLPGAPVVPLRETMKFTYPVACGEGLPKTCLAMESWSVPEAETIAPLVGRTLTEVLQVEVTVHELGIHNSAQMRINPETLQTHSFSMEQRITMEIEVEGKRQRGTRVNRFSAQLSW